MEKFSIFFISFLILSCSSDNDEPIKEVTVTIKFTQNWDGKEFTKNDFATTEFTNKQGTKLSIEKLKYLISMITLTNGIGKTTILKIPSNEKIQSENQYTLIDVKREESLTFTAPEKFSEGSYNISFTFGFNNEDNKTGEYTDLNTASWNVGTMLGGGYHFMQLEGKFLNKNSEKQGFAYHTIRATDNSNPMSLVTKDTSFIINLGSVTVKNDATIEIKMNIAGWFKSPNNWNLNMLNTELMPNFEAQKLMSANGKVGVFSLGNVTQ